MKGWRIAASALAVILGTGAGAERPLLRPIHDVDVIYAVDAGDGTTLHERLRWRAAAQELRLDPPTAGLYVIIDLAARRMSTVRTAERMVVETAAPDNVTGMPDSAAAAAVRGATDEVAGLACTDWDMTDAAGEVARVCLTDDGVLLRARAGGRTLLSAETVVTGPLDAALFQVPADYARRSLGHRPAGPGPQGAPSAGGQSTGAQSAGGNSAGGKSGGGQSAGGQSAGTLSASPQSAGRHPASPHPASPN